MVLSLDGGVLEFLELGTTPGISTVPLDHLDDLTSEAINISVGFPFADFVSFSAFVSLEIICIDHRSPLILILTFFSGFRQWLYLFWSKMGCLRHHSRPLP